MKRTIALIALLCLAVFTLPNITEAKSPPGAHQVSQDYQENISESTAGIAGYQHTIIVTDGTEVDIGAHDIIAFTRPMPALLSPHEGYKSATGRAATNERMNPSDNMANTYMSTARAATQYSRRV